MRLFYFIFSRIRKAPTLLIIPPETFTVRSFKSKTLYIFLYIILEATERAHTITDKPN